MRRYKITTAPLVEPVTLSEVKAALNIETSDDDDLIEDYIAEARRLIEEQCSSALITQTVTEKYDDFSVVLELSVNPVQSVTSIQYIDEDGATKTVSASDYVVDTYSIPTRIAEGPDANWPSTQDRIATVTVVYVAGYGNTAGSVPLPLKRAIHLYVGSFYEQREDVAQTQRTRARMLIENFDFSSW
jgi:uncharacterized phiE125 gp8 family phage protein